MFFYFNNEGSTMATSTYSSTETIINLISVRNPNKDPKHLSEIDAITVLRGFGFDTAHLIDTDTPDQKPKAS